MPRPKPSSDLQPADAGPREIPTDYFDDAWVEIYPAAGDHKATAGALLDAAGRLGYSEPARAVHAISGGYRTPKDVLDAADLTDAGT